MNMQQILPLRHAPQSSLLKAGVLFLCALLAHVAQAQTIPVATVTSSQTLQSISGNSGHVAVNTLGDIFYVSQTANIAYEIPHGTTTPIAIVTGLSGGRSVALDKNQNLYVPSNYSGRVIEIPFISGTYATNVANSSSLPVCPSTGIALIPCQPFSNGGAATGYYLQATDLAFDGAGNLYLLGERAGGGSCDTTTTAATCNLLLEYPATSGAVLPATNGTLIAGGINGQLPQNNSAQLTVDSAGDVFYADGTTLYEISATNIAAINSAKTPALAASMALTSAIILTPAVGLKTPGGVAIDSFGNLYVSDSGNNRFVEFPQVNGVPQPASAFVFSNTYSANSAAVDPAGRLVYTGYANSTSNLSILTPWSANFGTLTPGTPSAVTSLGISFNGPVTPATIALTSVSNGAFALSGGTCAATTAYVAGGSCTIGVTYTPNAVGVQNGAVSLFSATGANLLTAFLSGSGLGAAQTVDPGVVTAIGSGFKTPFGTALDAARNVYVADAGANAVYRFAAGTSTSTTVGTGLAGPTAVAVDGAGNVYIADSGNGRVLEVPVQNGVLSNASQTVLFTGTKGATGLNIDYTGSLYIADSGNSRLLRLTNIGGTPSTGYQATIGTAGSTFKAPIAVATDTQNHIFVADQTGNAVYLITLGSSAATPIGSALSQPSGLALDPAGSLYIADTGNFRVLKIPSETGTFNANDQFAVAQSVASPYGLALDSAGNLYVSDGVNATLSQVARTQGLLYLGQANINTTTSTLTSQISSSGNQTLTFGTPLYVQTGTAAPFTITAPASVGCAAGQSLTPGFSCTLTASFTPTVAASVNTKLAFTDNAANTASPSLTVSGIGTNLPATTLTLALATAGTPIIGQPVTVNATITSTTSGTPTGQVSFLLNGATYQKPVTVTGKTVSIVLNGLSGGTQVVGASYSGDANFASAAATPFSFIVAKAPSTVSFITTSTYPNPQSAAPGFKPMFTATVVPGSTRVPTGTVTFFSGTTPLATGQVTVNSTAVGGVTTTTYTAAATSIALPSNAYSITAVYNGDANYLASTSAPVPLIISLPAFTITPSAQAYAAVAGQPASVSILVQSLGGLAGNVSMACTGLPVYTSCSFGPNGLAIDGTSISTDGNGNSYQGQLVTLRIFTDQLPNIPPPAVGSLRLPGTGKGLPVSLALLIFAPLGLLARHRLARFGKGMRLLAMALFLAVGAASLSLTGCGNNTFLGNTPQGTYNVTITGILSTAAPVVNYTQSATIAFTVK